MNNKLNLLIYFLRKDIKAKYAGSALGILWTFLMPAVQILLLWFVFSAIMKARPYANTNMPYIYFLLSSYFFWLAFSEGLMRASNSILENTDIVKKISFPNIVLPVAVTLSSYLPHIVGFMLFITAYSFATSFSPVILLVVFIVVLQLLFSAGMGMLFSSLLPYVRDLGQILSQVLAGLFFLSPIIYSMEAVPGKIKILFQINPLTYFIVSYHKIILLREMPDFFDISIIVLLAAGSLACGFYAFNRLKEGFPDVL